LLGRIARFAGKNERIARFVTQNLLFAGCERWNPNLFKKDKFSALWSCKFDLVSQMRGCSSIKFECAFMGLYLVSLNLVTVEKIDLSGLVLRILKFRTKGFGNICAPKF